MKNGSFALACALVLATSSLACSSSGGSGNTDDGGTGDGDHLDSTPIDTAGPATCADLVCPRYECTCNDGSKMQGSGCSDAVCNSGKDECDFVCSSSGGTRSVKELPAADAGPSDTGTKTDGGAATCPSSADPCSNCVAAHCCTEATACAGDKDCQTAAICVSLKCTGSWDKCAPECNTTANDVFNKYSACIVANGCATICKP